MKKTFATQQSDALDKALAMLTIPERAVVFKWMNLAQDFMVDEVVEEKPVGEIRLVLVTG